MGGQPQAAEQIKCNLAGYVNKLYFLTYALSRMKKSKPAAACC